MIKRIFQTALAALALAGLPVMAAAGTQNARRVDLLFTGGQVLTIDRAFRIASTVAVKDGRIVAIGGPKVAGQFKAATVIDLAGRTLMPGFIDTHLHLFGLSPRAVEPDKARSISELKAMVTAKARELGAGAWITGYGWDEAAFAERRNPTRADLDAAAPDNPVVLVRAGSHSSVSNSAALRLAGITAATPEPEGGVIERGADGVPTGIIRERTDLVTRLVPTDTPEQMRPSLVRSLKALLPLGITSFMEAFSSIDDEPVGRGGKAPGDSATGPARNSWKQFRSIYAEHGRDLPRVALYIAYPGAERLRAFPYRTGHGDDRLKLGPIGENPYDGGFTGPTALTKQDYKGLPGFRGKASMTDVEAREIVAVSAARGWQLGIHAIGDAAIEKVAGFYHEALIRQPRADHRWFLSHFTMLPSDETMRMLAADGVHAAAQPNFLYTLAARYEATLDGARLEHVNPVATPLARGLRMAFGSDNLPIGPMTGIYAAVTRATPDGQVIGASERIARQTALTLYTREAARLTWDERKKGTIEVGKFADLIVLDRDPLTVDATKLLQTRVDMTVIDGRIVYRR